MRLCVFIILDEMSQNLALNKYLATSQYEYTNTPTQGVT